MPRRWIAIGALLVMVGSVTIAAAQAPEVAQDAPVLAPMEVQRLLDAAVVLEAEKALELTEAQYPQFLTRLRAFQEMRRRNEQTRVRLIRELNRLVNTAAEGGEPQIRERLSALDELETSGANELQKARAELVQTLNLRQQARLRLFEERMEQRKLQLLQEMRNRQQRRQQQQQQRQQPQRLPQR